MSKLIVGLGNPGREYDRTRHNVGFMAIDAFLEGFDGVSSKSQFKSLISDVMIEKERVHFVKPQTFMNLSGEAVLALKSFYKVNFQDILIILDDYELNFGEIRLRKKGSAGTHNGLLSVLSLLGSEAIPRMRVGVGPRDERMGTVDFVLGGFSDDERERLPDVLKNGIEAVRCFCLDGVDVAMNRFNGLK